MVAEGPLFRAGGLFENYRINPTLVAGEWTFQNGDASGLYLGTGA